ncbi:MAG: sulfotransferase [Lewinellaceae bacterium]|nr:sulfotransferase [Saprospiraceae bacterium]MCB9340399.1 sulfotransferase [Lewinellaceae bacterium]
MILAGGSGSTGSSLLQAILNRHPSVLAGQETCLFIYPHLFYKWNRYKNYLLSRGILGVKSTGWSLRNGADLLHPDYGWERAELESVIRQSTDFKSFVGQFFKKTMQRTGAVLWVEKTPQNAVSFQVFLREFPQGRVVQMTRNPLDTMASLLARGFHPYEAAGYYIYHTAAAASVMGHERYYLVAYEDLVQRPHLVTRPLLSFMGVPADDHILQPTEEELANPVKIDSWNHSERGTIASTSVGRFQSLPETEQRLIIAALNVFRISPLHQQQHGIKIAGYQALCQEFGYEYQETDPRPFLADFERFRRRDMWRRTLRLHPGNILAYPGIIDENRKG